MAEFKTAEKIRNIKNGIAMKMVSHFLYTYMSNMVIHTIYLRG